MSTIRTGAAFHVTVKTNRDVTDDEVKRLPGWTRNPAQAHYIQADVEAASIGAAADTVDRALRAAGPGLFSLTMQVRVAETGPLGTTPRPPGAASPTR